MAEKNLRFRDLFHGIDPDKLTIENPISVPDSAFRQLLEDVIERGSLEDVGQRRSFYVNEEPNAPIIWLKITRLPVSPSNVSDYNLFDRWQGVLSAMHEWGYRFYFMLQRAGGETGLYLGVRSESADINSRNAMEQIQEATSGNMPGIELKNIEPLELMRMMDGMSKYHSIGAVTGLPSFFDGRQPGVLQTLDSLSFGIRGANGEERDFSLLIAADPITDRETSDIMNRMRSLGSEIHSFVNRTVSDSHRSGESQQKTLGGVAGAVGSAAAQIAIGAIFQSPIISTLVGSAIGGVMANNQKTISEDHSLTVQTAYLDKFAEYAEQLTDKHVTRMKEGRNLGYWNVGVYVLGKDRKDVATVNGMLRSVYAGSETYVEPIRLHILEENSGAMEIVRNRFNLIPLFDPSVPGMTEQTEWHIFGRHYQYLSTPMNTKELALATSLPKNDAPGLRFVKTAVRFANNPPVVDGESITLGNVVNMGVKQNAKYVINHNDLVRHALVVGSTGSGKSCSCKRVVKEILEKDIPSLIIEPAKDDWVRWAIKMNEFLPDEKKFRIYMPGSEEFDGYPLQTLQLSPFEPAGVKGAKVDMTARCENLIALLNASLPSEDILPVLIDETVYAIYSVAFREEFTGGGMVEQKSLYPLLSSMGMMSKRVMKTKNYEAKVQSNLATCLETRFQYLTRGTRGKLLNVTKSTDYAELFDHPTIINISGISAARDKALIMSFLLLSLYEYRKSQYAYDADYRRRAQENRLLHLTLIEEAHNVLLKPEGNAANNPQKVVADLFTNMLSEIRSYGQGMMIVDQYPTRLIPDAIKNTNYKIVHRLASPDDAQVMAASTALRPEQMALIPALGPGNAIIFGDRDDAAAWIQMQKTEF